MQKQRRLRRLAAVFWGLGTHVDYTQVSITGNESMVFKRASDPSMLTSTSKG